eukprot:gb/GECG01011385.1/.p1 GENE.gb/GECG01011385.1/~~gb/GECG01011385.1/.p1  ORF type:complete len:905 (+),score=143.25 gb/GECG01011385.1/:1-2715(+)
MLNGHLSHDTHGNRLYEDVKHFKEDMYYLSNMHGLLDEYTARHSSSNRGPFKPKIVGPHGSDNDYTTEERLQGSSYALDDSTYDDEEPKKVTTRSWSWDKQDGHNRVRQEPFSATNGGKSWSHNPKRSRTHSDDSVEAEHHSSAMSSEEEAQSATIKGASTRSENPCSFSTRKSRSQLSPQQVLESRTWSSGTNKKSSLDFPTSIEEDGELDAPFVASHSRQQGPMISHGGSTATSSQQAQHNMEDSLGIMGDREPTGRSRPFSMLLQDYTMSLGQERNSLPRRKYGSKRVKDLVQANSNPAAMATESKSESARGSASQRRREAKTCRPKMEGARAKSRAQNSAKSRKGKELDDLSNSLKNETELEEFNRRVASLALQMIPRDSSSAALEYQSRHATAPGTKQFGCSKPSGKKDKNAFLNKPDHKRKNVGNKLRQRGRCFVQDAKSQDKEGGGARRAPVPPSKPASKFGPATKSQPKRKGGKPVSFSKSSASNSSSKTKSTEATAVSSNQRQQKLSEAEFPTEGKEIHTGGKSRVNFKDDVADGNSENIVTPAGTPHTMKKKQCGSFYSSIMGAKERTPYNPSGMTPYTPATRPQQEPSSSNVKFSRGVPLSEAKKRLHLDDMLSPCLRASRSEGLFENGELQEDEDASYQSLSISGDSSSRQSRGSEEPEELEPPGREPPGRPNKLAGVFEKLQMEDLGEDQENLSTIEEDEIDTTGLTKSQLEDSFIRAQLNLSRSQVKEAWNSQHDQVLEPDNVEGQEDTDYADHSQRHTEELSFEQMQMLDLPYQETPECGTESCNWAFKRTVENAGPMEESQYHILQVHNHARQNRRRELKGILLNGDMGIDTPDEDGMTLLLIAAENGYEKLARMLIHDFEADLTCVDNFGNTALHYALKNGTFQSLQ